MQKIKFRPAMFVDTVQGICPECKEDVFLIGIVHDYYRCTNCGEDIKQYVNGHIKYLKLRESDKDYIKKNGTKSSSR